MKTATAHVSAAGTARIDLPEGAKLCYVSGRVNNVSAIRIYYKEDYIQVPASSSRAFNPNIPWPFNADNHLEVDCSGANDVTAIYEE